jgi:hypothetical protein
LQGDKAGTDQHVLRSAVNQTVESYGLLVLLSQCLLVAPSIQPSCESADGIILHLPNKLIRILVAVSQCGPLAYFCDYSDDNLAISWSAAEERPYTIKLVNNLQIAHNLFHYATV